MFGKIVSLCLYSCIIYLLCAAAVASQNLLYVGNSRGDDISIIDLSSFKVVGVIKLGDRIHGIAVQPDGKRLFATV